MTVLDNMVLDTNVLIEILKNNQQTIKQVESLSPPLFVSVISAMELIYGALNNQELKKLQQFLSLFTIIQLNEKVSQQAFSLITKYAKSHTLDIPDALIAASCLDNNKTLFTYNRKDFHFIPKLTLLDE
tara:strand:- start:76 stop:462 length:387 start_codon:yes stop_codon:yes gene_type:complete